MTASNVARLDRRCPRRRHPRTSTLAGRLPPRPWRRRPGSSARHRSRAPGRPVPARRAAASVWPPAPAATSSTRVPSPTLGQVEHQLGGRRRASARASVPQRSHASAAVLPLLAGRLLVLHRVESHPLPSCLRLRTTWRRTGAELTMRGAGQVRHPWPARIFGSVAVPGAEGWQVVTSDASNVSAVTAREREVLRLIEAHLTNSQIPRRTVPVGAHCRVPCVVAPAKAAGLRPAQSGQNGGAGRRRSARRGRSMAGGGVVLRRPRTRTREPWVGRRRPPDGHRHRAGRVGRRGWPGSSPGNSPAAEPTGAGSLTLCGSPTRTWSSGRWLRRSGWWNRRVVHWSMRSRPPSGTVTAC